MRKVLILLCMMILLVGSSGCSKAVASQKVEESGIASTTKNLKEGDKEKFSVGYLPSTGHLLYFVAKEKGYFDEEGLDVELVLFSENNSMLAAMLNKKLDVGALGSTNSILYISQGSDVTVFGGAMTEGHALAVKPEVIQGSGEKADLTALKGKRIALTLGGTADVVFRQGIIDSGLEVGKDVEFVSVESGAAAFTSLKNGEIDGAILFTPYRKLAEDAGFKILAYSGEVEGFEKHPCCRQVAVTTSLNENPDRYVGFLRALIKAYKFYQLNKEETVDIIAKYVDIDKDILSEETYGPYISSNPDPDKKAFLKFYEAMVNIDYVKAFDIEPNINTQLYEEALDSILQEYPNDETYKSLEAYHNR